MTITPLHRAAWDGDLAAVMQLVADGADVNNRDNPQSATPLSWAHHNKQAEIVSWLIAHCKIDLHDAVALNLRDHVEARLREDPSAVHRQVDMWRIPQTTPLYWAASTRINDADGPRALDEADRLAIVRLLLDAGADPNIAAGDGRTPLDVARASGASTIVALLESRGATGTVVKSSSE